MFSNHICQMKDGKAIKMLATASRLDIEDFLQKKVYLEVTTCAFLLSFFGGAVVSRRLPSATAIEWLLTANASYLVQIDVKVKENWRQDERLLKRYGYSGEIQAL